MPRAFRSFAIIALASIGAAPISAQQEIDNVTAFARLYGVARWFYPSDAAAALDWDRFAVHGVSRVRAARTPAELERTLEELFAPLGPGIEIGTTLTAKPALGARDASLIAWHYRGPGFTKNVRGPYSTKRMNRSAPAQAPTTALGVLMQNVPAYTLRGKTIRLRGRVRVADPEAPGWAGLWLRVDRPDRAMGFFDNMQDRPVRDTAWREYVIEGPVAFDALNIAIGALASGNISVDVDAIELWVHREGGSWTPVEIADPSFEMPPHSNKSWMENGKYVFTRPTSAPDGDQFARVAAPPVSLAAASAPPEAPSDSLETPFAGASIDVELARGLKARVRLSLTDAEARVPAEAAPLAALRDALSKVSNPRIRSDVDVRLADAVVAWNVFRHFYPYWSDLGVDWDARLRPQLQTALNASSAREGHLEALRALVADVQDGHGNVYDAAVFARMRMTLLPLRFRLVENRLVVTGSAEASIPVGSVVMAIDGVSVVERVAKAMRLASGTSQWRQTRAENELLMCRMDSVVNIALEPPTGATRSASLRCSHSSVPVRESRPDTVAELEPGIWYVDLTRVKAGSLSLVLEKLGSARGVVFDVRGYPTDLGHQLLPFLMTAAEDSTTHRWMHVPRIAGPFGQIVDWRGATWNLRPATPHIGARRVFLTDARAISYAESVMGYVRDHKLGTTVGGTTAGANGNVASFTVPGGFNVMFTGMRVTRHDGRTPFHMLGVSPDVPIEPTLAGIRAGRDEVLERALMLLRPQP